MKKTLLILTAILSFNLSTAQWTEGTFKDEFGDPTGKTYRSFEADGVFTNSATYNSKCKFSIQDTFDSLIIYVFEYGTRLATEVDSTFEVVKIKKPSGDVVTINKVYFHKSGKLYFANYKKGNKYDEVMDAISESGDYVMIFNRSGKYSNSNYKLKFTIK